MTFLSCQLGMRHFVNLLTMPSFGIHFPLILGLICGSCMQHKFFGFGSFAQGQVHFPKIRKLIVSEKTGFVKGQVYRLRCGYPALVPGPGGLVSGPLYDLQAPESYFAVLDALLQVTPQTPGKGLFNRVEISVAIDNFSQVSAFAYCLNPLKVHTTRKIITGGDWQKELKEAPPILSRLQDRQKQYIHKLSRSKGRDIVPIKLDLYRELMNLELIVDKGRRLALTPMGKEAALFMES